MVNLSIKSVPDDIAERLRERAARNHRSVQGEMMAILEAAVDAPQPLTADELLAEVKRLELRTPRESAAMVRTDRDRR